MNFLKSEAGFRSFFGVYLSVSTVTFCTRKLPSGSLRVTLHDTPASIVSRKTNMTGNRLKTSVSC